MKCAERERLAKAWHESVAMHFQATSALIDEGSTEGAFEFALQKAREAFCIVKERRLELAGHCQEHRCADAILSVLGINPRGG